jgi:hypothetical protein
MSSITRAEALLISHAQVLGAFIDTNDTDQLLSRIPKVRIRGDALNATKYLNANLGGAAFVSSGGAANASPTTYSSPARSFPLRRIAARVEVAGDIAQNVSMVNDVFQEQIEAKMISIWNAVSTKLISGTNADPDPAGLVTLAAENPDGVGDNLVAPLTLAALDDMIMHVRPWDGGSPRAFVVNRGQFRRISGLAHASGFDLPILPDPMLGKPVAHYMGVPILVSDFITDAEVGDTTSVYLVYLGSREGEPQLGGLVWFYNEDTGPGVRVDGPLRTSDATDLMFATLELNIGFASLSTGSVYRLSKVSP